jgi:anti-sigma-K factor RskA
VLQTQAKLALLGDPQLRTAVLATTPATPPGAQAHLLLSPDRSSALLTLNGVKPLPVSQTYEFWLIQDGKPLPAGTFRVDPSGNAQFLVQASQPLRDFQQAGITIERAGGSQTPTVSAMIFAGPIHE